MKRRLTKVVGSIVLASSFLGGAQNAFSQDDVSKQANKETERAAKRLAREQCDYEKLLRWTRRHEAKTTARLTDERKFATPYTARGSEIGFWDANGVFVTLGYIDKTNEFRSYYR